MTVDYDGYRWVAGTIETADLNLGYSSHEGNLEPVFRNLLEGGVFLDIGAHVGHWTVRLAGQAEKVIAVEPDPGTAAILRQNLELNDIRNVTVIEAAAWDSNELLRLEDPREREYSGTNRTIPDSKGTIHGTVLDDILRDEPEIRLVKIDVEGADLHVLRGLAKTIARCAPAMIVERHDFLGYYEADDLFQLLSELGYVWENAPFYLGEAHLIATPRDGNEISPYRWRRIHWLSPGEKAYR